MTCPSTAPIVPLVGVPAILAGLWFLVRRRTWRGDATARLGGATQAIGLVLAGLWFAASGMLPFTRGTCPPPPPMASLVSALRSPVGRGQLEDVVVDAVILGIGLELLGLGALLATDWRGITVRAAAAVKGATWLPSWVLSPRARQPLPSRMRGVGVLGLVVGALTTAGAAALLARLV